MTLALPGLAFLGLRWWRTRPIKAGDSVILLWGSHPAEVESVSGLTATIWVQDVPHPYAQSVSLDLLRRWTAKERFRAWLLNY